MSHRNIVVIGSSSGGIETLRTIVPALPSDLPAAVFVVQHVSRNSENLLPRILSSVDRLPVQLATDGAAIQIGRVYVAPANHHVIIDTDQMFLSSAPRVNRVRPAVDPLFRSAALSHGPRVIGVILSGSLDDGTSGLIAVKNAGGATIVQDPDEAITPDMPQSAMDAVTVDHCLLSKDIAPTIDRLCREEINQRYGDQPIKDVGLQAEFDILRRGSGDIPHVVDLGQMVPVTCPDCGGPLWETDETFPRFRCHTGHVYTGRHLAAGLQEREETALWAALRVMEERVRMLRRLADNDEKTKRRHTALDFREKANETERHVQGLKALLVPRNRNW